MSRFLHHFNFLHEHVDRTSCNDKDSIIRRAFHIPLKPRVICYHFHPYPARPLTNVILLSGVVDIHAHVVSDTKKVFPLPLVRLAPSRTHQEGSPLFFFFFRISAPSQFFDSPLITPLPLQELKDPAYCAKSLILGMQLNVSSLSFALRPRPRHSPHRT